MRAPAEIKETAEKWWWATLPLLTTGQGAHGYWSIFRASTDVTAAISAICKVNDDVWCVGGERDRLGGLYRPVGAHDVVLTHPTP